MSSDKFIGPLTAPTPLLRRLVTLTAELVAGGGGGGAVSSVFTRTGAVTAQVGDYSSFYGQLAAANVWTGTNGFSGQLYRISTPMVTTSIDVTRASLNRTLVASEQESFSATPATDLQFIVSYTATGGPWTVTWASPLYSYGQNGDISAIGMTIPANGTYAVTYVYSTVRGRWEISGEPTLTTGTGVYVLSDSPTLTTRVTLNTQDTSTTLRGYNVNQFSNDTLTAAYNARKARGTIAAPLVIVTGDGLGRFATFGYDGSAYVSAGLMTWTSTGTIGSSRVPSQWNLFTSTDASPSVQTLALTVGSDQKATFSGEIVAPASTTARASLNLPTGVAPTSPADGDEWTTTAGKFVRINGSTVGPLSSGDGEIVVNIGDGTNIITTGEAVTARLSMPFNCTLTGWTLLADTSTTTTIGVWKDTFANYPATIADTITATHDPAISAATKNTNTNITNWGSTAVTKGDQMGFHVIANNNAHWVQLTINYSRP